MFLATETPTASVLMPSEEKAKRKKKETAKETSASSWVASVEMNPCRLEIEEDAASQSSCIEEQRGRYITPCYEQCLLRACCKAFSDIDLR